MQAEVALAAGRTQLAESLERAAELAAVPDELLLEVYTALRPRRATAAELEEWASAARGAARPRRRRHSSVRQRLRTRSEDSSSMGSRRFASRATRDLHLEQLVSPLPELGLVAANGPNDPEPELVVVDGVVTRMDGRSATDFDVIDRFVVAHGLDLEVAVEAMALDDLDLARRLVDVNVSRAELVRLSRGLTPAKLARVIGLLDPVELMLALKKLRARRAPAQPGARDEPQGEPGAPRRRRGRGGAARLRRDGDDGRRRALRAAERDRAPRRIADRTPRSDDAVRGRGAAQPRARDPRPRDLRGDALGVRHRAGLRRRRRHAVVEGVPGRGVRVARREGALHVRHRLGGAHGLRAGALDALPRGSLPRGRARGGLAGRAERFDLVRRARPLRAGRDAGDPRRERARGVARPRGRVRQRRDRVALGDPQDGEAHGPVPSGDGLRDLGLLGDAAARQHVRRGELRRGRPRRVADDPARLAGRCGHRARVRRGAPASCASERPAPCRPCSPSSGCPRSRTRRSPLRPRATTRARCRIAIEPPTSRRPTSCSREARPASTSRGRSTGAGSPTSPRLCSACSASGSRRTICRRRRSSTRTASCALQ